ncbi:MAG: globin [Alphaproteobacteria bacterium]|nr:globin [Alphaproteobacteria bacterium]
MIDGGPSAGAAAIEASLAAFAARCPDPVPAVYARVFAAHPGFEAHFRRDTRGFIKGEMLARAFEVILDHVGDKHYANTMVAAEMVTHESYDVPRAVFASFFASIRDTVRDTLADDWTAETEVAWSALVNELTALAGA